MNNFLPNPDQGINCLKIDGPSLDRTAIMTIVQVSQAMISEGKTKTSFEKNGCQGIVGTEKKKAVLGVIAGYLFEATIIWAGGTKRSTVTFITKKLFTPKNPPSDALPRGQKPIYA